MRILEVKGDDELEELNKGCDELKEDLQIERNLRRTAQDEVIRLTEFKIKIMDLRDFCKRSADSEITKEVFRLKYAWFVEKLDKILKGI